MILTREAGEQAGCHGYPRTAGCGAGILRYEMSLDPMKQAVRNAKKQTQTRRSKPVIRLEPGLQNLDQILIAQGILTQTSDKYAVAMALGLADRKKATDFIFEVPPSR